jgi:hypothetical protein
MLHTYTATRYIVPLREGGSLPAVLDTEEGGHYVAKFRGAGQGSKALIAEIIVGLIGISLGLPVPELALIHLDESFGRTERDPEIQDILKGSRGMNVGLRYLAGAFNYDPVAVTEIDPDLAAETVWLDAFTTNIDRTPRNPNILFRDGRLWLIDHGAALYFHHDWGGVTDERIDTPFAPIRDHVLLPFAGDIGAADARLSQRLNDDLLRHIIEAIPDELLMDAPSGTRPSFASAEENREAYYNYLHRRLRGPRSFVEEAIRARQMRRSEKARPQSYRR